MSAIEERLAEISALATGPGGPEWRSHEARLLAIHLQAQAAGQELALEIAAIRSAARADAVEYAAYLCDGCIQCARDIRALAARGANG